MSNINLNLYRTFCGVAQSKSYSEASEKLNISTPAISLNITKLEDLLDTVLFDRTINGVKLTEDGKKLFEKVNEGLEAVDEGERLIKNKSDFPNGEIVIGCPSHIANAYLMDYIQKLQEEYPGMKVELTSAANSIELQNLLQNHAIDFVIDTVVPQEAEKNIEIETLKTIDNIFVSKEKIEITDIKEMEKYRYILNFDYTITMVKLIDILKRYKISIEAVFKCDTTELRVEAVKRNMGVAYVSRESVKKELANGELYEMTIPIELPVAEIKLIYLKNELTKANRRFIREYLKD